MKDLYTYIKESISKVKFGDGIVVFDIDDTLLTPNSDIVRIIKHKPGEKPLVLSSDEYAKDPDVESHKEWFDFNDFRNPEKVLKSILTGTPKIKNLKILDDYVNAGYKFCFLTARGCEDVVKYAIQTFLKIRGTDGELRSLGLDFDKKNSHAINDANKNYKGSTDAERKANILNGLCDKFDKVVFVDDDIKNIKNAESLNRENLKIIKAW